MTSYILKVGKSASARLDMLQALHGKYSQQFIAQLQLSESSSILDIGCGVGNMSRWFAGQFPFATIVGLDNSEAQLTIAKQRAQKKQLTNIEFVYGDLELLTDYWQRFDIIYSRYSIIHVRNPESVLQNLKNLLTKTGCIILEEPTMSSAFCYPDNHAYKKSRALLKELARLRGFDFDIGQKLEKILHHLGFSILHRKLVQPLLETIDEKQMLISLTDECRDAYLSHGLSSEDELSNIITQLENLIHAQGTFIGFPRTTQLCAIAAQDGVL